MPAIHRRPRRGRSVLVAVLLVAIGGLFGSMGGANATTTGLAPASASAAMTSTVAPVSLDQAVTAAAKTTVCPYPYVCFMTYTGHYVTSMFRDVTSYYQPIGSASKYSKVVANSRHDDVAYIKYKNIGGATEVICVKPRQVWVFGSMHWYNVGIRISYSSRC